MTKNHEQKIRKQIKSLIKDVKDSDELLIDELIDWLKIGNKSKQALNEAIKAGEPMGWNMLTTISMSTKNVMAILNALNITPEKRNKKLKEEDKKGFDIQSFINGNNGN